MKPFRRRTQPIRGVNLGGWLVLEKWMTPSLFADSASVDEYTFCQQASAADRRKLKRHRDTFITEKDFIWLAAHDVQAVRLPVGWWLFGDDSPNAKPYEPTVDYVDKAFAWAKQHGLQVLLCLHGAPGSQNGNDHSGRSGAIAWSQQENVKQTLMVVERIAQRYGKQSALMGIELLNEPALSLSSAVLKRYYRQAYKLVRRHCLPAVCVVISDSFQLPRQQWWLHWPRYRRVCVDTHQYQCFSPADKALSIGGHLRRTARIGNQLRRVAWHRRLIVGEWSAALDAASLQGLSDKEQQRAYHNYVQAQLHAYRHARAWFFWSYRIEDGQNESAWSYRDVYAQGWLDSVDEKPTTS